MLVDDRLVLFDTIGTVPQSVALFRVFHGLCSFASLALLFLFITHRATSGDITRVSALAGIVI